MKTILVACLLVVASARPQQQDSFVEEDPNRARDRLAQITSFENVRTEDGGNSNSFSANNGLEQQQTITLQEVEVINEDGEVEIRVVPFVKGFYRYLLDDGSVVERFYYTDQTGYHIQADDLPVAPLPAGR